MTTAQTQFSATLQTAVPDVSIVIPTCNRPDLVGRAVRSVLQQTLRAIEVIVVVDGGSEATVERLEAFEDRRLRTVVLAKRSGPAVARNVGVAQARAEWVSFLDDDDEMLPDRIAKQLAAARASSARYPVVVCRYYVQSRNGRYVYPDLLPEQTTEVSEYLFDRRGITGAIGGLGTSSILVKRELLRHVPYPDLPRHEDWGWALEASRHAGWELRVIAEPLTIVHIQAGVSSISRPRLAGLVTLGAELSKMHHAQSVCFFSTGPRRAHGERRR